MSLIILAISISLNNNNIWWVVPLGIAGMGLIFWSYSRTVPRISASWRYFLLFLRVLSFIILLLILLEPALTIGIKRNSLPELKVLIDASASMGISDRLAARPQVLKTVFNPDNSKQLEKLYNTKYYLFSDSLLEAGQKSLDSLEFTGSVTNITGALEAVLEKSEREHSAILLVTDGAYNFGAEPARVAENSLLPIYIVAIGDSLPQNDVGIADIDFPPIAYLGDESALDLIVSGFPQATGSLKLLNQNNRIVTGVQINFGVQEREKRCRLNFTPDKIGDQIYQVILDTQNPDLIPQNNSRHFSMKVLPDRINILLVAGAPNPDFAFLQRILLRNPDLNLQTRVEQTDGKFYFTNDEIDPDKIDIIILLNYPTVNSDIAFLNTISTALNSGKSAVLIPGWSLATNRLDRMKSAFPVAFGIRGGEDVFTRLIPEADISPLLDLFPGGYDWKKLPPVRYFPGFIRFSAQIANLASTEKGEGAIGYVTSGQGKALILAVHDLWRLSLQDPEHSESDSLITGFWNRTTRWLAMKEEEELFQMSTNVKVISSGNKIVFKCRLFDRSYRPLSQALVKLKITSPGNEELWLDLKPSDAGNYSCAYRFHEEGSYRNQGYAIIGKDTLVSEGEFAVEAFNPELIDPEMRPEVLRKIAFNSKAQFYLPDQFRRFFADFKSEPYVKISSQKVILFPQLKCLSILVLLIALELFIRKRKGLL